MANVIVPCFYIYRFAGNIADYSGVPTPSVQRADGPATPSSICQPIGLGSVSSFYSTNATITAAGNGATYTVSILTQPWLNPAWSVGNNTVAEGVGKATITYDFDALGLNAFRAYWTSSGFNSQAGRIRWPLVGGAQISHSLTVNTGAGTVACALSWTCYRWYHVDSVGTESIWHTGWTLLQYRLNGGTAVSVTPTAGTESARSLYLAIEDGTGIDMHGQTPKNSTTPYTAAVTLPISTQSVEWRLGNEYGEWTPWARWKFNPAAAFTTDGANPLAVNASTSSSLFAALTNYAFNTTGKAIANSGTPTFTYNPTGGLAEGTTSGTLTVTTDAGCTNTVAQSVTIEAGDWPQVLYDPNVGALYTIYKDGTTLKSSRAFDSPTAIAQPGTSGALTIDTGVGNFAATLTADGPLVCYDKATTVYYAVFDGAAWSAPVQITTGLKIMTVVYDDATGTLIALAKDGTTAKRALFRRKPDETLGPAVTVTATGLPSMSGATLGMTQAGGELRAVVKTGTGGGLTFAPYRSENEGKDWTS